MKEEIAIHCSVLVWRIPRTGKPGGLMSMGSHRVGNDWSDLVAAAAATSFFTSRQLWHPVHLFALIFHLSPEVVYSPVILWWFPPATGIVHQILEYCMYYAVLHYTISASAFPLSKKSSPNLFLMVFQCSFNIYFYLFIYFGCFGS